MGRLSTASNLADPDAAYRLLVEAHRGRPEIESAALDSALVLLLANHIGDLDILREALALAQRAAQNPQAAAAATTEQT